MEEKTSNAAKVIKRMINEKERLSTAEIDSKNAAATNTSKNKIKNKKTNYQYVYHYYILYQKRSVKAQSGRKSICFNIAPIYS